MIMTPPPDQPKPSLLQRILGGLLTSRLGDIVASTWLGQWLIINSTALSVRSQTGRSIQHPRFAKSAIFRRRRTRDEDAQTGQLETLQQLIFEIQANIESEEQILLRIVKGVVEDMHYLAAFVATYEEQDDSLPVRTYYVNPHVASEEQIHLWEMLSSQVTGIPLTLSDPKIARVEVHKSRFATNLSVRAYKSKRPVKDTELISLFRPVVPDHRPAIRCVVKGIQKGLGIKEVIAVPFFRPTAEGDTMKYEFVGNLFALTTARSFEKQEVQLLQAFGQQAAAGLKNARLYHQVEEQQRIAEEQRQLAEEQRQLAEERQRIAEEQRQLAEGRRRSAEIFGKMAFNAATNVHDLTNHIGMIRMRFNSIINNVRKVEQFPEEQLQDIEKKKQIIEDRLDKATSILKNLHEPWSVPPDALTNVNTCLSNAMQKLGLVEEQWIEMSLGELPAIQTSPVMLSEAFRVIIKNAVEAIEEKGGDRRLWVRSSVKEPGYIELTIRDNGIGIKPEDIGKVFEMGWSTKKVGLGFGLFWAKDFIEEGLEGKLQVESAWQQGTTFRIYVPFVNHMLV